MYRRHQENRSKNKPLVFKCKVLVPLDDRLQEEVQKECLMMSSVQSEWPQPHSDGGPDGVAGLDEPANHGWCKNSDTSGRRSGSNTKIC